MLSDILGTSPDLFGKSGGTKALILVSVGKWDWSQCLLGSAFPFGFSSRDRLHRSGQQSSSRLTIELAERIPSPSMKQNHLSTPSGAKRALRIDEQRVKPFAQH